MRIKSIALLFAALSALSGCATTQHETSATATGDTTASWPWPSSMDAVSAAPGNHKVLYEDDKIRILSVTVQPGEKENSHFHRWPSVLLVDSPAKKKEYTWDGKIISTDRPPTETPLPIILRMAPSKPHAIENLDTNALHLYRIEFKTLDFKN